MSRSAANRTSALGRLRATVAQFSPGQKLVAVLAIVAVVVGGTFFARWAGTPTFAPLFSDLSGEDANAIVERLEADGTPYELTNGGATILVPREAVYGTRLTMSGEGLPSGDSTGYAIMDSSTLTSSEFQQHVQYRRALEGELARTLMALDGVETAVVHLALPERSVFTTKDQQPTASVLLSVRPGAEITGQQTRSIIHLVASSVEGLSPEMVAVSDQTGTVLAQPGEDGVLGASGDLRAQQTQAFEQRLNTSVEQMLTKVVGAGNAVVKVTADLDFDQRSTTTENFVADPEVPPISESTTTENMTGGGVPAGGVLGPENEALEGLEGAGEGTYDKTQTTRNNAVGKVLEETTAAPGAVRRLSVAVVLDAQAAGNVDVDAVRTLVSGAVGLDVARGDTLGVDRLAFDESATEAAQAELEAVQEGEQRAELMSMVRTGGLVFLVILCLIIGLRFSRRPKAGELDAAERLQLEDMRRQLEDQAGLMRELEAVAAGPQAISAAPDERMLALAATNADHEAVRASVRGLVEQQPDEVAALLRSWLADRRT